MTDPVLPAPLLPTPDFATLIARLTGGPDAGSNPCLPQPDPHAIAHARTRQANLTKPPGSLGRLEDIAIFMAGWQGTPRPTITHAQAVIFAGNHGICAQGVNPYPQEVTGQMVANFRAGGAAINHLCRASGADLKVVALDLDQPTADFTQGPAMTEAEVLSAMAQGAAAIDPTAQIIALGEMGIGNSTVAAALCCALFGGTPAEWVGPGTGSDDTGIARKTDAIARGLARHAPNLASFPAQPPAWPLSILAAFGGREQAAICGAVLAAREARIPVVLDGFICTAAAAILSPLSGSLAHCLAGHSSAEPGHKRLLHTLGLMPILDLGMRLGEGSGAALALGIVRAALGVHDGMATFAEASVAEG